MEVQAADQQQVKNTTSSPTVEITAEQFIRLIVGSLNNQVVCFGENVLRLKDGTVEGQESSMLVQNLSFQSVINTEVDQMEQEGDYEGAQELKDGIDLYADDGGSLRGVIGPRKDTLMRGQFNLE